MVLYLEKFPFSRLTSYNLDAFSALPESDDLTFARVLSYFVQLVVVCVHGDIRFNFVGEVILEDVP